jgi:transposase
MARRTKLEPHLTPEELKARFRTSKDRSERSHFQALWLISQGKTQAETAQLVGFCERWVQEIVKRYNTEGPEAMRDRRHEHPGAAPALDTEGKQALAAALQARPADTGLWTSKKAAAWIRGHTGRAVCTVTGWRTLRRLRQTPQRPRPEHKRSDPEAQEAFKDGSAAAPGRSTGAVPRRGGGDLGDG